MVISVRFLEEGIDIFLVFERDDDVDDDVDEVDEVDEIDDADELRSEGCLAVLSWS